MLGTVSGLEAQSGDGLCGAWQEKIQEDDTRTRRSHKGGKRVGEENCAGVLEAVRRARVKGQSSE